MEEETNVVKTEQEDAANKEDATNNDGEPSVDMPNNTPTKRGRGRPQGSKKLKVCVTDVNLMELVSGISNGGATQTPMGRGRPKLLKDTEQQAPGDNHSENSVQTPRSRGRPKGSKKQASDESSATTDHTPKKRGRPRKSLDESTFEKGDAKDLPNGGSDRPKLGRGSPKGSTKTKLDSLSSGDENEGSSVAPRKRGRPKGSPNKKPRLLREVFGDGDAEPYGNLSSQKRGRGRPRKVEVNSRESTQNGIAKTPRRGRGRPRKNIEHKGGELTEGSQPVKRGRGRPKGSLNKKTAAHGVHGKVGRPQTLHAQPTKEKRGRPRKEPAKRGRPRKYPLPSPEELKKPKVWKPLGRPRKYPRVDPPEGASPPPRRSRGRPRKSESKKGAHLRKSMPATPSSPRNTNDRTPRKRGRPPSTAKTAQDTPRKRGRPRSSLKKNNARNETQPDSALPNHSESDLPAAAVVVEGEAELVQEEQVEHDIEMTTVEHEDSTEEMLLDQDAGFEVSNQT